MTTIDYFKHMYGALKALEGVDIRNVFEKKDKKWVLKIRKPEVIFGQN